VSPYRIGPGPAPDVLICAGLDPSGGAGLIADTRVAAELGARPVGVITALTVQNTTGVIACTASDPEIIGHQLSFLLTDIEVKGVKIGMIGSTAVAKAIAKQLELTAAPVVWDPILYPSRGDVALVDSLFGEALKALAPHVTVVTPNARELAYLAGMPTRTTIEATAAGRALAKKLDCAVLVKGGHIPGADSIDVLIHGAHQTELHAPRVEGGEHVHGTGCALATAIAAHLANGRDLVEACSLAKQYVTTHIAKPARSGRGSASLV
jgi:hydroxymethylpyrimidine/phosphomethylpyrimidine kinase